jgi:hypothetical protein
LISTLQKSIRPKKGFKRVQNDAVKRNTNARVVRKSVVLEAKDLQFISAFRGDARRLQLPANLVDIIVTSSPYWRKRDYKIPGQIGWELWKENKERD